MDVSTVAAICVLAFYAIAEIVIKVIDSYTTKDPHLEDEIISMVNEGHEQGVIETSEATMISNIFDFADKEAGDIMTNRSNIIAIDSDTSLHDALNFMLNNNNSRYPVYSENIDNITGILFLKDAMRFSARGTSSDKSISDIKGLIRRAMFVPETININDLFKTMQSKKTQLAIVVDEYGQTVGIISMEDILEEIVGNIMDEYDVEEKHIRKKGKNSYILDGLTPLSDIEKLLNIDFEVDDFETLNGYMISKLDRLPVKDEQFSTLVGDYEFKIIAVENRIISKVEVNKIESKEEVN